jgi:hypothetical protein
LPDGFDQRFFKKLNDSKELMTTTKSPSAQTSFLSLLRSSFAPLAFATCLIIIVANQSTNTLTTASQIYGLVDDISADVGHLGDENWDILLQVAKN